MHDYGSAMTRIETERLILRPFEPQDLDAFAALNADPVVMEHFPAVMTRDETEAFMDRIAEKQARVGYAVGAVLDKADGAFLGLCGLNLFEIDLPWTPETEIGWRFTRASWGKGYASEAARAWLAYGFGTLGLSRIVAFTATANHASSKVMERIGMERAEHLDFQHTHVPPGHPLAPHIVYQMTAP
ncbi:GNAT family N-acetyltransferase [Anianabacter salinae]|uniref:GNAT family N-acetyltransferase n=1 Tax=Anianabacter salinae TaxID=2851023 RepID=UPI00225E3564|nr:GNAT family N-acetyltransferase [Anianabacter salinae]MBV0911367.1 GNAT family N-acetyltransferase [Anianabacter salinae]